MAAIWVTFLPQPGMGTEFQGPRHRAAGDRLLAGLIACSRLAALPLTLPAASPA